MQVAIKEESGAAVAVHKGYRSKEQIEKDKAKAREKKQREEYERTWGWKGDGQRMKAKLDKQFSRVLGILGPHQHKKEMVHLLNKMSHRARHSKNVLNRPFAMWLMRTVIDHRRGKGHFTPKSELINIKWTLMSEINRAVADFDQNERLRPIEKMLIKNVRVNRPTVMELQMKRVAVSDKNENLQLVLRTLEACNAMLTCTSIQHNKPAGCPICGGIESARGLHVISVHRTSGEKTLLSWDIEMQNLAKEQEVCENELNAVKEELKVFQDILFYKTSCAIQNWWCMFLARRKSAGKRATMLKSCWYYDIRRLAHIKRRIDRELSDNVLDIEKLKAKYPDFILQISEYLAKIAAVKQAKTDGVARVFLTKLRNAVIKARKKAFESVERKRREAKKREEHNKKIQGERELSNMRLRLKAIERRNLICIRPECNLRHFKSLARFNTHMKLHYMRDDEYKLELKAKREDERMRKDKEKTFYGLIDHVRVALEGVPPDSPDGTLALEEGGGASVSSHSWADASLFSDAEADGGGDGIAMGTSMEGTADLYPDATNPPLSPLIANALPRSSTPVASDSAGASADRAEGTGDENENENEEEVEEEEPSDTTRMMMQQMQMQQRAKTPSSPKARLSHWAGLEKARDRTLAAGDEWTVYSASSATHAVLKTFEDASTVVTASTAEESIGQEGGSMRSMTTLQRREHLREKERVRERDHGAIVFDTLPAPAPLPEPRPLNWSEHHPHFQVVSAHLHAPLHHLELLSKHGDVDVPSRVPLHKPVMRMGTLEGLEVTLKPFGFCRKYMMVSKIHCLIYVPMAHCDGPITVCDNRSLWGTYVINANGAHKAPVKVGSGTPVSPGDLLCIGVRPNGPEELSPDIAGQACCVYRVRSHAVEETEKSLDG